MLREPPLKVSKPSTATAKLSKAAKLSTAKLSVLWLHCHLCDLLQKLAERESILSGLCWGLGNCEQKYLIKPWIWICPDFQKTLDSDSSFFAGRVDRKTDWLNKFRNRLRAYLIGCHTCHPWLGHETGRKVKYNTNVKNSHIFFTITFQIFPNVHFPKIN